MAGMDLTEFYPELQGRPESKNTLDMENRWPYIPPGHIRAGMIKDFGLLVSYLSEMEVMTDDMLGLLLDENYGLEARYELLDTWIEGLEIDIAGIIKSLQDIQHKDDNYTYTRTTDALQAISDDIDQQHLNIHILFIIPEAVGSITADNIALRTELLKLGDVLTITQADALEFPAFGSYAIAVLGSNSGSAWTTSNLADLKNILGLTLVCVDKVAAAYFEIGNDGGDATSKTVIRAISEIEGTKMGEGDANHQSVTGIDAGNNTISSSATYHTLDMSNANSTETVFCTEANDPDGGTANQDVVLGMIRRIQNDGTIGVDEAGDDIPATLGFAGFAYEGDKLNTLGKALFLLFFHMLVQLRIQEGAIEAGGLIIDIRKRLFGNMKGSFTNADPLVEYIAGKDSVGGKLPVGTSLPDLINTIDGIVDTLLTRITAAIATASGLSTHDTDIKALLSTVQTDLDNPSQYKADLSTLETRLSATRAGYLDQLDFALQEAIAAIPTTMVGTDNAALASTLEDAMQKATGPAYNQDTDSLEALRELLDTIEGYLTTEIADILTDTGTTIPALLSTIQTDLDNPSQYKADVSGITTSGPTNTQMNTGHGLLATPAQVATELETYDAVKRSEATSDKDAVIAAIPAMVGTNNAATETKQDIIDALVDSVEAVGPMSYLDAGGEQTVKEDTATTRRRIWLEFSNRNMTQTGKFILYRKVDGSNYDIYVTELVTVAAGDDRAFDVEFTTNQAWKLTYTEDVNEGAARNIPYNVITQVIE